MAAGYDADNMNIAGEVSVNAAENNAFWVVAIAIFKVVDAGMAVYDGYQLVEEFRSEDTTDERKQEIAQELLEDGSLSLVGGRLAKKLFDLIDEKLGIAKEAHLKQLEDALPNRGQRLETAGGPDWNDRDHGTDPNMYSSNDKKYNINGDGVLGGEGPYDPRKIRDELESEYPNGVKSTTVPPLNKPNVRLANKVKHAQLKNGTKIGITFNSKGLPIFDDHAKVDMRIGVKEFREAGYDKQFSLSTRKLREMVEAGSVDSSGFTKEALRDIKAGKPKIEGYTWHHHEDTGRMQLLPMELHSLVRHAGWNSLNKGQ